MTNKQKAESTKPFFKCVVARDWQFWIFRLQTSKLYMKEIQVQIELFFCIGGLLELTFTLRNEGIEVRAIVVMFEFIAGLGIRPFKIFINNMKIVKK